MKARNRFLTAEWKNILMLNYSVDPSLLQRFVPRGTILDTFEGKTYLSLVGFEFNRTRICGIAVPFHQNFEEVNLRFYFRHGAKRRVVFVRELVPKFGVAAIARFCFSENYSCAPMSHRFEVRGKMGGVKVEYAWGTGPHRCSMGIETEVSCFLPAEGSLGQFITEHYWGYSAQKDGGCLEYEVQHPRWSVKNAKWAKLSGSVPQLYGAEMARTLAHNPDSAFLAEGSPVTVFKGKRII